MVKKILHQFSLLIFSLVLSCGASTNIFHYTTTNSQTEAFDNLLALALAYYDSGQYEKALEYAEKAYLMNSVSEQAAVMLGYVYLGLAGVGPFDLVKNMMSVKEEKKEGGEAGESSSSSSSKLMTQLRTTIGLTQADLDKIGTVDRSEPDLPIIIPKCAEEARTLLEKLTRVNQAISVVCPFVSKDVKIDMENRHKCAMVGGERHLTYKAYFLWAFAHLTEALSFHTVLLYSATTSASSGGKTNLEYRMEKLKDREVTNATQMAEFVTAVDSMKNTVSAIFPMGGICSLKYPTAQFIALLYDMLAVNRAFAQTPGIPPTVVAALAKSMDRIELARDRATSSSDAATEQTKSMKGDMTEAMSKVLKDKMNALQESGQPVSAADKASLCGSFESISGGAAQEKPALCN